MWPFLRNLLFQIDAETTHRLAMKALSLWSTVASTQFATNDLSRHPSLTRTFFGLTFPNPLGLAAGFDKDAEAVPALQRLGFGFLEVGTMTAKPQEGNPRPRLFRLPEDQALMNRMGFNNAGAVVVAKRVERYRRQGKIVVPLGVNIGKSKSAALEKAAQDYLESFAATADVADYIAINISSPNTPGLRDLQQEDHLIQLLDAICDANQKRRMPRPLLLKLAPDLDDVSALSCAKIAVDHGLSGLIISNTTISRDGLRSALPPGSGGISGKPVRARSTAMLRLIKEEFRDKLVLIGVGGIMHADDALEKINAGADLLQVYTGFVYGGPKFPSHILRRLYK
ncbi:MAG: quinone-dependent dihydroorotate dehydrogenase [Deltaproteobacteria bacterium]|nr:quinone-dependent dihydroorotate dehydrogenase [Deltaproteobacteria bacterium]